MRQCVELFFMRIILIILVLINWTHLRGQVVMTGTVIDLGTNKPIAVTSKAFRFFLSGKKTVSIPIDSVGQFVIEKTELSLLGDTLNLSIGTMGTDYRYADFEFINIPADKLELVIKKIFVTKTFMIPSCGADCFTVDNKRTYKRKSIAVNNGILKYMMKRIPEKRVSNSPFSEVKYQTDFKKDLV